jgi:hypothetical protein
MCVVSDISHKKKFWEEVVIFTFLQKLPSILQVLQEINMMHLKLHSGKARRKETTRKTKA